MTVEDVDEAEGVSRCTVDDLVELRTFRAANYEASNRVHDQVRADWLFLRHPSRPDDRPTIWVCRRDAHIVGTLASIPFDVKVEDRYHRGSWGVDLMVDPQWRGAGIAPALTEARRRSCCVSAGLSISDGAHRSALRRRSTDMGDVPKFLRLVDPTAILHWEGAPRPVRLLALPLVTPALWLLDQVDRARTRHVDLVHVDTFDERVDALWEAESARYGVISRRDSSWLKWRFDECPDRGAYRRYYLLHRQHLFGYLVVRRTTWSGHPALAVIDYFARPDDTARLLSASLRVARELGAVAVLCDTLNAQARTAFRNGGFFRRRNQGIRFLAYTTDERLKPVVLDPGNWFITAADSDLD